MKVKVQSSRDVGESEKSGKVQWFSCLLTECGEREGGRGGRSHCRSGEGASISNSKREGAIISRKEGAGIVDERL